MAANQADNTPGSSRNNQGKLRIQPICRDDELKEHLLSSMVKEVGNGIFLAIQSHITGNWAAGQVTYTLENGGVGYATSGGYVDDIVSQLEAFKSQIVNGDIVVSRNPLDY